MCLSVWILSNGDRDASPWGYSADGTKQCTENPSAGCHCHEDTGRAGSPVFPGRLLQILKSSEVSSPLYRLLKRIIIVVIMIIIICSNT